MLDEGTRIALGNPELPPECEVSSQRYEYNPRPQDLEEVMPNHVFFHFFFSRPNGHQKPKWIYRLPKKLKESILDSNNNDLPVGWGVHINEGPDYHVICAFVLLGLVISGVLSICWATLTKDVQGAFGMGAYFATVEAAWMATMYFKWSQE